MGVWLCSSEQGETWVLAPSAAEPPHNAWRIKASWHNGGGDDKGNKAHDNKDKQGFHFHYQSNRLELKVFSAFFFFLSKASSVRAMR